jgi:rod shape determining protein RodA
VAKHTPTNVQEIDRVTLAIYIGLVIIGWFMIYAVNYDKDNPMSFLSLSTEPGKQLFFIVASMGLLFVIFMSDWAFWRTFSFIIYIITVLFLIGPILIGKEINGAYSWYQIGGFSLQPGEFAKFGTSLALAAYLSSTGGSLRDTRGRMFAFGIFMLPILIIVLQNDVGSALVFFSFFLVMYREGLSPAWYAAGIGAAAMVILGLRFEAPYIVAGLMMFVNYNLIQRIRERQNIWMAVWVLLIPLTWWWEPLLQWREIVLPYPKLMVLVPHVLLLFAAFLPNYLNKNSLVQGQLQAWLLTLCLAAGLVFSANFAYTKVLAPHQQVRIKLWLKPWEVTDTRGAAYNLIHSKMAIGAGGFTGKGFLGGNMTRLRYVPEQSTDYIFCTVGEEHGFIGTASVLILFALLMLRLTTMAERQRSNFSRVYMYCIVGIIFVHFIVNTGMTMGLIPTIGIPLPLISYGGSSLLGFTLMIGVALKLDSHRALA